MKTSQVILNQNESFVSETCQMCRCYLCAEMYMC